MMNIMAGAATAAAAAAAHVLRTKERARFTVVIFSSFRVPSCQQARKAKRPASFVSRTPIQRIMAEAAIMIVVVPRNAGKVLL